MTGAVGERLGDTPPQTSFVHVGTEIGEGAWSNSEHVVGLRGNVGRVALNGGDPAQPEHLGQREMRRTKNRERGPSLGVDIGSEQSGQTRRGDLCDLLAGPPTVGREGRPSETNRLPFRPGCERVEDRLPESHAGFGQELIGRLAFLSNVAHDSTLAHLRWHAQ